MTGARDTEAERAMTSAPNDTARGLYQVQGIRNPQLVDDVYTGVAQPQIEAAKLQLRRAYIVAGVLIGVSILTAIVPAIYVASTSTSFDVSGRGNWSVCWPCGHSTNEMCCATLTKVDSRCNTITAVGVTNKQ